jgi:hypothetical protein
MCSAEEFAAPSNSAPEALGEEGVTRFSGPLAPRDSVAIRAGDGALWSVGPSSARADSLWPPFAIVPRIRRCSLYRPAHQAMQLAVAREDLARVEIQRRAV